MERRSRLFISFAASLRRMGLALVWARITPVSLGSDYLTSLFAGDQFHGFDIPCRCKAKYLSIEI